MTNERQGLTPDRKAVTGGFSPSVDFISAVLAGLAIGLGLDWAFNTRPALTIVFVVAGVITGFYKLWRSSAVLEEMATERQRGI